MLKNRLIIMPTQGSVDPIDAALLRSLIQAPDASTIRLAEYIGVSRNTVHAHLKRWQQAAALLGFDRRINPEFLGYPLRAYVFTRVEQRSLSTVVAALGGIPEVVAVDGLSGEDDLQIHVLARDADDLYRIAGRILDVRGVERTRTSLVMRELIEFRLEQLLTNVDVSNPGPLK